MIHSSLVALFLALDLSVNPIWAAALPSPAQLPLNGEPSNTITVTTNGGDNPLDHKAEHRNATISTNSGVKLVRLRIRNGRSQTSTKKLFYTTRVFVGRSQTQILRVSLDTASGQTVLPATECSSQACLEHRRYWHHESGIEINADGSKVDVKSATSDAMTIGFSSLDLGDGSITGILVNESLCLSLFGDAAESKACTNVSMVAATHLSDIPFRAAPYDGTIGLGLQGLSLRQGFNFLHRLGVELKGSEIGSEQRSAHSSLHQFALYYGQHFGEAAFGGYNPKRLSSPLMWTPVLNPVEGYWQIQIASIRIGNHTVSACSANKCRAIIDSGSSVIGVHEKMLPEFAKAFPISSFLSKGSLGCAGPDLHLELLGGLQLTLKSEDYVQSVRTGCKPRFSSLDLPESFEGVLVLGVPLLSRYYTVFDWTPGGEKMAFGSAVPAQDDEVEAVMREETAEDWQEASESQPEETVVNQFDVVLALFQNFVTRVLILLCIIAFGTNQAAVRAFTSALENAASRKKLLQEVSELTIPITGSDIPEGDECVICLGSGNDDPEINMGIPGLRAILKCDAEKHLSSSKEHPRWLRLRCGHHFHETCIFEWLRKTKHCPVCRRHLKDTSSANWRGTTCAQVDGSNADEQMA